MILMLVVTVLSPVVRSVLVVMGTRNQMQGLGKQQEGRGRQEGSDDEGGKTNVDEAFELGLVLFADSSLMLLLRMLLHGLLLLAGVMTAHHGKGEEEETHERGEVDEEGDSDDLSPLFRRDALSNGR